jgi:hypothetical protein
MSKGIIYLIQPAELVTSFSLKNGTVKRLLEILCISNKPFSKNFVLGKTS